ncbi:MAG: TIGR03663 family protein, partial [Chloroflexota bacterium]|nr:TIGR03663 family protein [Chloroflexota bacterium]
MGEPKLDVRQVAFPRPPRSNGGNGTATGSVAERTAVDLAGYEREPDGDQTGRQGAHDDGAPRGAATAPRGTSRVPLTVETALYGLLVGLAAVTRFWDLGSRTLHHDESLHAWYSWLFTTGQGYVHDPLMHGPFLFHANALVYLLLGASDASSRFVPALFGTVLVGLPWLLRGPRQLGRWGALAASVLLLVSPSLLYQSRYIRHDIYTVVGAFVLLIAIVRYVDRPERRWLVTAGASIGFLLTNHEIVFGIVAIFLGVLWGALLWGRLRFLVPLHLTVGALLAAVWLVRPGPLAAALPEIPWDRAGTESPLPTRDNQLAFYAELLTHPLIVVVAILLALAVAAALVQIARTSASADLRRTVIGLLLVGLGGAALWAAAVALVDETGTTAIGGWRPFVSEARFVVGGTLVAAGAVAISAGLA